MRQAQNKNIDAIRTLTNHLTQGTELFDADRFAGACSKFEEAVRNMHREGIVHRDLFERNVISASGDFHLIDFDLAILRGYVTLTNFQEEVDTELGRLEKLIKRHVKA